MPRFVPDGQKCIICYVPAVHGRIKHKPSCPGERKVNVQETKVTGGNFKNVITLHFPCGMEKDVKRDRGEAPTMKDVALATVKHRDECDECV